MKTIQVLIASFSGQTVLINVSIENHMVIEIQQVHENGFKIEENEFTIYVSGILASMRTYLRQDFRELLDYIEWQNKPENQAIKLKIKVYGQI